MRKKNVITNYHIYRSYRYPFFIKIFLEKFFFPNFYSSQTRYLIVTFSHKIPRLGFQQVLKIQSSDSSDIIESEIKRRLYRQNDYLYLKPKFISLTQILIFTLFIVISLSLLTIYLIFRCFPNPQNYFFPTSNCKVFQKPSILNFLLGSPLPQWRDYNQDLILRRSLISQLPKHSLYLDFLYSHGLAYSSLYESYLNSLKANSLDFSFFSHDFSVSDVAIKLTLTSHQINGSLTFTPNVKLPSLISLYMPAPLHFAGINLDNQSLSLSDYSLQNSHLLIQTTNFTSTSKITLLFDTFYPGQNNYLKIYYSLPYQLSAPRSSLIITYPPQAVINVKTPPSFAQTGLLRYNLPPAGLAVIELYPHY